MIFLLSPSVHVTITPHPESSLTRMITKTGFMVVFLLAYYQREARMRVR